MIPTPTEIEQRIEVGEVSFPRIFATLDCDAQIRLRRSSRVFKSAIETAYDEIQRLRFILNETASTRALRTLCFDQVMECTGHRVMADCVAHDFRMIGTAGYFAAHESFDSYGNSTIDWLWNEYADGSFPVPPIQFDL